MKLIPTTEMVQKAIQAKKIQNIEFHPNLHSTLNEIAYLNYSLDSNQVRCLKCFQNLSLINSNK